MEKYVILALVLVVFVVGLLTTEPSILGDVKKGPGSVKSPSLKKEPKPCFTVPGRDKCYTRKTDMPTVYTICCVDPRTTSSMTMTAWSDELRAHGGEWPCPSGYEVDDLHKNNCPEAAAMYRQIRQKYDAFVRDRAAYVEECKNIGGKLVVPNLFGVSIECRTYPGENSPCSSDRVPKVCSKPVSPTLQSVIQTDKKLSVNDEYGRLSRCPEISEEEVRKKEHKCSLTPETGGWLVSVLDEKTGCGKILCKSWNKVREI